MLHAIFFSTDKRLQEYFLKSPIPPSKVKWSAPYLHTFTTQDPHANITRQLRNVSSIIMEIDTSSRRPACDHMSDEKRE